MGMKNRAEFLRANAHVTKLNVDELLLIVRDLIKGRETKQPVPEEKSAKESEEVAVKIEELQPAD